jgi:branched-chain amino acid transport system permease protein
LSIAAEFPQREGAYAGGAAGLSLPPGDRLLPACDLSLAVAAGSVALAVLVGRSRLGLALMSLREDEEVAAVFGVHALRYKTLALVLSAVPPGLIGGVYTWQLTSINPSIVFGLEVALVPIVMAMLGGWGTPGVPCSVPSSSPSSKSSCGPKGPICIYPLTA